ncbi:hypothetical protein [Riemerella columbipharyngis]|uniref:hypothetical protein n=1 Tax=Riemerella columbipharyngis TaxID=1071918 RepID=UPI0015A1DAAE|nr:hypothetical protein [Riemerella columbipharyngis]
MMISLWLDNLDSDRIAKDGYTLIYGFPFYDFIRNDAELKKLLLGLLETKAYKGIE